MRIIGALLAITVCGCGVEKPAEMLKTGGVGACDAAKYPCGPFGFTLESAIENVKMVGRRDSDGSGVVDAKDDLLNIALADYYQNKQVKALFVVVAAEWCGPCRAEQPDLVRTYREYQAKGGNVAYIQAMAQDNSRRPASMATVDRWTAQFKIPFEMVADPANALGPYYNSAAFPMQMLIRTRDMTIVFQETGNHIKTVQGLIANILAEE